MNASNERIPYPDSAERNASIGMIVARGMPQRAGLVASVTDVVRALGVRNLFFGVWDCVFVGLIGAACVWGLMFVGAGGSSLWSDVGLGRFCVLMFLVSPFLYECVHLLIMFKERDCHTLDVLRACKWSFRRIAAVRMLAFGAVSVVLDTACGIGIALMIGARVSAMTILGVSFSSLFLFALGQLAVDARCSWPVSAAIMPAVWLLVSAAGWWFAADLVVWLERLPSLVCLGIGIAAGILYCASLNRYGAASLAKASYRARGEHGQALRPAF